MVSIIIPANNEETVIERCLSAIIKGSKVDELEVIVACNGCNDKTAEIASKFHPSIKVIEIEKASKTNALNKADELARHFPRFYIDADVIVSLDSIKSISQYMQNRNHLLTSPFVDTDTSSSSFLVKAFYDIWLNLPYNKIMVGSGVYVLSKEGRERFGAFPDVIADDGFVRFNFAPEERGLVDVATVTVFAPHNIKELIAVKTRSRLGFYQLKHDYPELFENENRSDKKEGIKSLSRSSLYLLKAFIYFIVNIIVRFEAKRKLKDLHNYDWVKDESSRA